VEAQNSKWGLLGCTGCGCSDVHHLLHLALAENERPPFDLVEAESELVAGFMVEYGSTPYMMFMLGEYWRSHDVPMTTILFMADGCRRFRSCVHLGAGVVWSR